MNDAAFGYRGLFVLFRREGEPSGVNRIYRLYREEALIARGKSGVRQSGRVTYPGRGTTQCALG